MVEKVVQRKKALDPAVLDQMRRDMEEQLRSEMMAQMGGVQLSDDQQHKVGGCLACHGDWWRHTVLCVCVCVCVCAASSC